MPDNQIAAAIARLEERMDHIRESFDKFEERLTGLDDRVKWINAIIKVCTTLGSVVLAYTGIVKSWWPAGGSK